MCTVPSVLWWQQRKSQMTDAPNKTQHWCVAACPHSHCWDPLSFCHASKPASSHELLYEPQGNLPAPYHCRSLTATTPHYGKENQKLHSAILNGRYLISLLIFFTVLKADASITAVFIKSSWQAQNRLPWRKLAARAWRKIKILMAFHLNPERSP